jgi:8-oxo-dGTP pyrophosphatase MutT (NUDIX family)
VDRCIRPLALALIRRGQEILVEEGRDEVKNEIFSRLLGGTIELGEHGADAVCRELREELGVEADVERFIAALENVFTYRGEPGHEIALLYECSLRDGRLYSLDEWEAHERSSDDSITHRVAWRSLEAFRSGLAILYPAGVLALTDDPPGG